METNIVQQLEEAIANSSERLQGQQLDRLEEASKEFDKLVSLGIAKRRGNNLSSITDVHLDKPNVNERQSEVFINQNFYISNI